MTIMVPETNVSIPIDAMIARYQNELQIANARRIMGDCQIQELIATLNQERADVRKYNDEVAKHVEELEQKLAQLEGGVTVDQGAEATDEAEPADENQVEGFGTPTFEVLEGGDTTVVHPPTHKRAPNRSKKR